jgi:hypothetical protein
MMCVLLTMCRSDPSHPPLLSVLHIPTNKNVSRARKHAKTRGIGPIRTARLHGLTAAAEAAAAAVQVASPGPARIDPLDRRLRPCRRHLLFSALALLALGVPVLRRVRQTVGRHSTPSAGSGPWAGCQS